MTTTAASQRVYTRRDGVSTRARLEHDFTAHYGWSPQTKQLDALEAIAKWLQRCRHNDGPMFHRSLSQIIRGKLGAELGWTPQGSVYADRQRYRNNFVNRLRVLRELGWIASFDPVYKTNGEGTGWLIQLPSRRRGYSSVGEATGVERRPHCSAPPRCDLHGLHRRNFFSDRLHPPSGTAYAVLPRAVRPWWQDGKEREMGVRPPARTREGGGSAFAVNDSTERPGLEELRQLAREGAEPLALVEAAFRRIFDASPRLSHRKWGETLKRALRRADRYRGERHELGAGLGWIIDRMVADRERGRFPHSAAFYVHELDFHSRDWRRRERKARPEVPRC